MKGAMPPTAIFAESNLMAVETLHELQKRSLKIPNKMAFIAFDDFDAATLVSPTITVVKQPVADLGRRAAELLCARLDGSRSGETARITLKTELLIRQSCGCKG
jgi:LacI family transcriptional regulator